MIDLHDESFELVTKLKLSHSRRNTSLVYISTVATKRERGLVWRKRDQTIRLCHKIAFLHLQNTADTQCQSIVSQKQMVTFGSNVASNSVF